MSKMEEENKLLNMASAPHSTGINASHGHATTNEVDEIKGTMVPNNKVNMAKGRCERSEEDTYANENESVIYVEEVKDTRTL